MSQAPDPCAFRSQVPRFTLSSCGVAAGGRMGVPGFNPFARALAVPRSCRSTSRPRKRTRRGDRDEASARGAADPSGRTPQAPYRIFSRWPLPMVPVLRGRLEMGR